MAAARQAHTTMHAHPTPPGAGERPLWLRSMLPHNLQSRRMRLIRDEAPRNKPSAAGRYERLLESMRGRASDSGSPPGPERPAPCEPHHLPERPALRALRGDETQPRPSSAFSRRTGPARRGFAAQARSAAQHTDLQRNAKNGQVLSRDLYSLAWAVQHLSSMRAAALTGCWSTTTMTIRSLFSPPRRTAGRSGITEFAAKATLNMLERLGCQALCRPRRSRSRV